MKKEMITYLKTAIVKFFKQKGILVTVKEF